MKTRHTMVLGFYRVLGLGIGFGFGFVFFEAKLVRAVMGIGMGDVDRGWG